MGAEGKYVSDTIREVNLAKLGDDMKKRCLFPATATNVTISDYETVMVSDLQEAKPIFKMRADYLEYVLNKTLTKEKLRIQFDTPQPVDATRQKANAANAAGWEVNFRMLNRDLSRIGVIKGGKESEDSDLRATIVREINEEVGVDVNGSPLTDMGQADGYQCFSLNLHDPSQIDLWLHSMKSRFKERYGEVMDLGFVKVAEKNKDTEVISRLPVTVKSVSGPGYLSPEGIKMNRKSDAAIDLFFQRTFPRALPLQALPLQALPLQALPSHAFVFAAPPLPGSDSTQRSVLPSGPSLHAVKRVPHDSWTRKTEGVRSRTDRKGGNKMCKTKKRRTIKGRHRRSKKSF